MLIYAHAREANGFTTKITKGTKVGAVREPPLGAGCVRYCIMQPFIKNGGDIHVAPPCYLFSSDLQPIRTLKTYSNPIFGGDITT
jgi:hypothetical protein